MSKPLEAVTNLVVLVACVAVLGVLAKDRLLHKAARSDAKSEVQRAQGPAVRPAVQRPAIPPVRRTSLDLGPDVSTVAGARVASDQIAATIDGEAITLDGLAGLVGSKMIAIEAQQYGLRRSALDRAVNRVLLNREARRRGVSLNQLIEREVEQGVASPSQAELRAVYQRNAARFQGLTEAEALTSLAAEERERVLNERRNSMLRKLRSASTVRILLKPPRVSVDATDAPVKGSDQAPVTIVEFADFQCPSCAEGQETLRRLEQRYPGQFRLAYKHFPLPMHQDAPRAAEAAECAREQGRFWEMSDKLFTAQSFGDADLRRYATEIGISAERFSECVKAGKNASKWQRDKLDGERAGVDATPTFFVNGRLVVGAPFDVLSAFVQEETALASVSPVKQAAANQVLREEER